MKPSNSHANEAGLPRQAHDKTAIPSPPSFHSRAIRPRASQMWPEDDPAFHVVPQLPPDQRRRALADARLMREHRIRWSATGELISKRPKHRASPSMVQSLASLNLGKQVRPFAKRFQDCVNVISIAIEIPHAHWCS